LDARVVIKKPILTERSSEMSERQNKYSFRVDRRANKIEIKNAVEELFKVKVVDVNTVVVRGKKKRVRYHIGRTTDWKKAFVTLKQGDKIDFA
jgi:large subunit ribosomal protein L23